MNINIENNPFDGFAIEFKEINPTDFNDNFIVGDKVIIEPNEDGFINEVLQSNLFLDIKNTVVINAAVGQGKSYAIIQTIKKYYDKNEKFLIVVVSPFVSLVKQYVDDIHRDAGIPVNQIFNYNELGRNPNPSYTNKTVQVLTANTLLGNPGEDAFKNSDIKRKYLEEIIKHCEDTNTKVVFIYDEIHDSFHNFKEKYIFNLWKWKDVIHKNFIISATYNEASKVIIEYLSELTDKKIRIIESKRTLFPEKQSSLHLHYSSSYWFKHNTPEIKNTIIDLLERERKLDILCYSKSLALSLIDEHTEIGKKLKEVFGEIKNCTSELVSRQRPDNNEPTNQYDNELCNVGTNFKTGVSIKKENHSFLIIMPPRATRLWFSNRYGIFSSGINSIIQAIARQRIKGEIHIVLPYPNKFVYSSLNSVMNVEQKKYFESLYFNIQHYEEEGSVSYIPLIEQDEILKFFYDEELKGYVSNEIEFINGLEQQNHRQGFPSLKFPSYKKFKLENGEKFLADNDKTPFFGEDISAYLTYSAITNQFINCKLSEITFSPILFFKKGNIQEQLKKYYYQYFGEDHFYSLGKNSNFQLFYDDIRNTFYKDFNLRYKREPDSRWELIQKNTPRAKEFELQLLGLVSNLYNNNKLITEDNKYSRGDYFLNCIHITKDMNAESIEDIELKNKVIFYQLLHYFRCKLTDKIEFYTRGNEYYMYLPIKPNSTFLNQREQVKFNTLKDLIIYDKLLSNNIFDYKANMTLDYFYTKLIDDFCTLGERLPRINIEGTRQHIKIITSIKFYQEKINIDLINTADYNYNNIKSVSF